MYGPRLNEYLSSLRAQSVDSGTQSECTIEEAIRSLRNPAKVSCATFETIIAIEKSLDYRHLLLLLSDTGVFPSCVRLLRLYCKEGRRIFDHAYGFLCLQVLGLAVDVGKVAQLQVNRLGDLRLHILQSPAVSIPLLLSSYSRQIEAREFCQDNEFLLRPATQTLGWYLDASSNHEACLFGIGGCTMQDVEFLLEQLWTDRKAFVQAGKYAATSWGWCGLLYVMHNTLAKMWGSFECRTESTKERTTWLRLCELSHRYSLCTGSTEDETMRYLLKDCPHFADLNYDVTATDAADTNQLIEAYVAKMATHPVVKWSYTSKLLGYICTNVHLDESRYEENLARITSANLEESWFLLAGAHTMDLEQWKVLVDTIMNNSIMTLQVSFTVARVVMLNAPPQQYNVS